MKRKHLSKMVALASALTLSLSVGMVAFAASPTEEDMVTTDTELPAGMHLEWTNGVEGIDDSTDAGKAALKVLNQSKEEVEKDIKEILNNSPACKHVAGSVEVVTVKEIDLVDGAGNVVTEKNFPSGGIDVTISAPGVKQGDVVYVLHWEKDGTCRVLEATVVGTEGGQVKVHLTSLSPVAVVKVMNENGGTPELKVVDTTAKSPKTGK